MNPILSLKKKNFFFHMKLLNFLYETLDTYIGKAI